MNGYYIGGRGKEDERTKGQWSSCESQERHYRRKRGLAQLAPNELE